MSEEIDREEGEIVDDEFEAISDSSMILVNDTTGKSVSPKEHLPVISLSSVSEDHDEEGSKKTKEKTRHHHKHRRKSKKKMKDKCCKTKRGLTKYTSSSSDEDTFHVKLQKQLKAAVRVETVDNHKNSLRNRLRAMTRITEDSVGTEKTSDNPKSNSDNQVDEQKVTLEEITEEVDSELIQLRLEALRTAVVNRHQHRKKRKVKDMEEEEEQKECNLDNLETNKENALNENINVKKPCLEEIMNSTPPEEDEDVLRALLLASIAKKITKDGETKQLDLPNIISKNNDAKSIPIVKKPVVPFRQIVPPKIKPIIINVDSDSESEEEKNKTNRTVITNTDKPKNVSNEIESSVEKFLREQRAKVEAQLVPTILEPKKPDSRIPPSLETKMTKTEIQLQNSNVTINKSKIEFHNSKITINKPKEVKMQHTGEPVILEKSSVKLLPKVKQIEYQRLLQKLKNAQKKPRFRRVSFRGTEDSNIMCKTLNRSKHHTTGVNNKVIDIEQDAMNLHLAMKQIQKQQNGSLQIEEKYVLLTPILKKINESKAERIQYDAEIKNLMTQLANAKRKLLDSQRSFSSYVKEFLKTKEEIDKSSLQPKLKKNGVSKVPFTSTPKKPELPKISLDMSTVPSTPNDTIPNSDNVPSKLSSANSSITTSTDAPPPALKTLEKVRETLEGTEMKIVDSEKEVKIVSEDVPTNSENLEKDIKNLETEKAGEMNEVDKMINAGDVNKIEEKYVPFPEYVSPLDPVKRKSTYNPFLIMCPFDIDGNCRDNECTYEHYSR